MRYLILLIFVPPLLLGVVGMLITLNKLEKMEQIRGWKPGAVVRMEVVRQKQAIRRLPSAIITGSAREVAILWDADSGKKLPIERSAEIAFFFFWKFCSSLPGPGKAIRGAA